MPDHRVGGKTGWWPAYEHTFEDMNGWGTKRLAEEREMQAKRLRATAAAVSRYDEVMRWNAELIHTVERRNYLLGWAKCRMNGESFEQYCEDASWCRMTAYRRIFSTVARIVDHLSKSGAQLRLPDERWLLQEVPKSDSNSTTMGLGDVEPPPPPSPKSFIAEKAKDMLSDETAVVMFGRFLQSTNNRRRSQRERRTKQMDAA
jgi:hypothetical protein